MQKLTGLWKLHIFEYKDANGEWQEYFWNKGGTGYILYDGKGHVALHITPKDYSDFNWNGETDIDSLPVEELKSALKLFSSNYVYIANCRILSGENIVEHTRISHTYPNDWGKVVQRRFEFKGDTLILFPVEEKVERRLKWLRAPEQVPVGN